MTHTFHASHESDFETFFRSWMDFLLMFDLSITNNLRNTIHVPIGGSGN